MRNAVLALSLLLGLTPALADGIAVPLSIPQNSLGAAMSFPPTASGGCSQATALIALMDGGQNTPAITTALCAIVASGAAVDGLHVYAINSAANAALNWMQNAFNITVNGSETFSANNGYTGGGGIGTDFLDPGFTPSTAGGAFSQNSASAGVCSLTSRTVAAATTLIGGNGPTVTADLEVDNLQIGNLAYGEINASGYQSFANANGQGSYITARTSAGGYTFYFNNTAQLPNPTNDVSVANIDGKIVIGAYFKNGIGAIQNSTDQIAWDIFGGGWTNAQVTTITSAMHNYVVTVRGSSPC